MPISGYKGISFPFRIGVKGGIVLSTTSPQEVPHIVESMQQIVTTRQNERPMEYHIFSDIDTDIFEPNDVSLHTLLKFQVAEALKLEKRIQVSPEDITIVAEEDKIYAQINFIVLSYNTQYSTKIEIGDMN